jgi:uncharacterized membrane protein
MTETAAAPSPSLPSLSARVPRPLRERLSPMFRPIVATLLRHRPTAAALGIAGAAQVALAALHVRGLECPFLRVTGFPCPGCGLSRACAAMIAGEIEHSLRMHAFALPAMVAIVVLLTAALMPATVRDRLGAVVERIERATGLSFLLQMAILVYWLARLLYAPRAFISLVGHP